MESIVFLDRGTVTVPFRKPHFIHEWADYDSTDSDRVLDRLRGATIAVTNKVRLREPQLDVLPKLKCIVLTATGYDNIDVGFCRKKGIVVSNVPGYARQSVPEHVLLLALALRRNLQAYLAAVRSGRWQKSGQPTLNDIPIDDLHGSVLGLVGYGTLAKGVEVLARAFGLEILVAERKGSLAVRPGRVSFEEVLSEADILSLHVPLTADTQHMIGARELSLMKPTALLINTARGGIVEEKSLLAALTGGHLGGAGFDVLSVEPPTAGNPLLDVALPNLIVTPHVAWTSRQAQTLLAEEVVRNIEAFVAGKPRNVVS